MVIYIVRLVNGTVFEVPYEKWTDDCISIGDTYTPENCLWFNEIEQGLSEHVPSSESFASVECKSK